MVTEQKLRADYEHALDCVICFCGNYKRIGKPFCFQCWDRLPWYGALSLDLAPPTNTTPPSNGLKPGGALHPPPIL